MNRREQMRLVDEGIAILEQLNSGAMSRKAEMLAVDRMLEIVELIGGSNPDISTVEKDFTPLLNSIITGNINVFTTQDTISELEQIDDEVDDDLLQSAAIAAARQVLVGLGEPVV